MKTAVKSPESAVYRRGLGIFLTNTPPTDTPKHLFRPLFPRNPHFPALRPDPLALSGASRRKQTPSSKVMVESLVFEHRSEISRVIFASPSHRGSHKATDFWGRLGSVI
ncbi:MAG: hypothetical protein ACRCXD_06490, partial [Luteolibacter sp.]